MPGSVDRLALDAGAAGVIVHMHGQGLAFDVEFLRKGGTSVGVETISATDLKAQEKPLRTKDDYKKALVKAAKLMDLNPASGSPDYWRLETLLGFIGAYESTPARFHKNS